MKCEGALYNEYPRSTPVIENAVWVAAIVLGAAILAPVHAAAAVAYAAYSVACLYLLIPRLVCTRCGYFGSTCHSGQGKIAALLFSPRDPSGFEASFRWMRLAAPVFLAPLVAGLPLLAIEFSVARLVLLAAFAVIALGLTRLVTKRLGCAHCRQRAACPACPGGEV